MASQIIFATDPAKGWRPWGALVPFLALGFVFATVISLQIALQQAQLIDAKENPVGLIGFMAFLLLPFGALGLVVLAWVRFVERRPVASIGLTADHPWRRFALGHLSGVAMMAVIVMGIWSLNGSVSGAIAPAFGSSAALGGIVLLLLGFALQSSVEEILFRGWMLSAVAAKFGIPAAVALSSLLFTLLHFDSAAPPLFFVNVVLFAVFACCWALRTGSIWGIMGWHAGWNWLLAVGFEQRVTSLDAHLPALLLKLTPTGSEYLTGGSPGAEASIVCTVLLSVAIAYNLWRARSHVATLPS
jgi:membrane protease YdiL (CAAX protease family)